MLIHNIIHNLSQLRLLANLEISVFNNNSSNSPYNNHSALIANSNWTNSSNNSSNKINGNQRIKKMFGQKEAVYLIWIILNLETKHCLNSSQPILRKMMIRFGEELEILIINFRVLINSHYHKIILVAHLFMDSNKPPILEDLTNNNNNKNLSYQIH